MEIKITTNQILKVLQLLSWIIFIGLCVQAGAIIVNTCITLFINPDGVKNFWDGADYLSELHKKDVGHFLIITVVMSIVAVLKAILFYLIVKLFVDKKINIAQPFIPAFQRFILKMAYLSLGIGLFSHCGQNFSEWLSDIGNSNADLQVLHIAGGDVWLFMTVILFVIAHIIKRGVEIQNENDLTI